MLLSELHTGESAIVVRVSGHGGFRRRIMEMGFVRGKEVKVLLNAPLKDPIKYQVMGYEVSLRRAEAAMIEVTTEHELAPPVASGEVIEHCGGTPPPHPGKTINIALVGNPNSGKTSLFNAASGAHEHVGNYGGVTVDAKKGRFHHGGYTFNIWDLPGTYSLSAYSPEEVFVRRHLSEKRPDVIVNVVAASNLERNLFLTTELIDMNCTAVVMALNMYDELEQSGGRLDYESLGGMLGVPIVPTAARSGMGVAALFDRLIEVYENRDPVVRHIHIPHIQDLEEGVDALREKIHDGSPYDFSPRWLAIKLLERDGEVEQLFNKEPDSQSLKELRDREVERIERVQGEDIETIVANDKYGFIAGALAENFTPGEPEQLKTTQVIDSLVTNKLFGFPIFLLLMWLMFECTFSLGAYPMEWLESGVGALGGWIQRTMSDGMLKDMLIDGVIGGVGGVIVFLPNILILYLFISFMEDSGYMARAAFIMDKLMHRIGLHGKSFIPLIMGFGCNVPAIMATRTIESRSSRLITILINPFMSCGARLPIYVLLAGTFFPQHAGLVMFGLYVFGVIVAVVTAKLLRKFFFRRDETPFVMELPPYRVPTWRATARHMWEKAWQYLRKMGGVILVASIAVWFLSYFPRVEGLEAVQQMENSYIGRAGHAVEPVMQPLGLDWKASVALVSGVAAKEIVVSTMSVLDAVDGLTQRSALSFLIFALLYFPCIAALTAIAKETGGWRYAVFSFIYNTAIAWFMAWAVYNIWGALA